MDIIRLFADGFPLTIERLQFLQQTYAKAFSQLSRIAGTGNIIIDGLQLDDPNAPTTVSSGVIIVDGEVLEFEGGAYDARVAIFETVNDVPYNVDADNDGNLDLKVADVVRTARCAATGGVDAFDFSTLTRVQNLQTLAMPIGSIVPYDGDINNIPLGWELYDMADKFIMGAGGTHSLNGEGGSNENVIGQANLPNYQITGSTVTAGSHSHPYRDGYFIEAFESPNDVINGYDSELVGSNFRGSGDTDSDNRYIWYKNRSTSFSGSHSHFVSLNSGGGNQPIDNRPSFRALHFIRRVAI